MSPETLHRKCRETRLTALSVLFHLCQDILISRWWQNLYIGRSSYKQKVLSLNSSHVNSNTNCRTIPLKKKKDWQNYLFRQHFSRRATVLQLIQDVNICCGCSFAKSLSSRNDTYQAFKIDLKRGGGGMSWQALTHKLEPSYKC